MRIISLLVSFGLGGGFDKTLYVGVAPVCVVSGNECGSVVDSRGVGGFVVPCI